MKSKKIALISAACIILLFGVVWQHFNSHKFVVETLAQKPTEPGIVHTFYAAAVETKPQIKPPQEKVLRLPILMYHHVGDLPDKADGTRQDLTVPTAEFEQQVKWLSENGYKSIHLADLDNYAKGKFIMPKKPVIFTFDDGYLDVFTNAVPILKKYNFTGSFAIITQFPGTQEGNNVYASWDVIRDAYRQGNEIVSHTQNHFDGSNPKFNSEFIQQNLCGSKTDLKQNLGINTNILIYPYGHYTPDYINQAKICGFNMSLTVHEGSRINLEDLMEIPRVRIHGRQNFERFKQLVSE
ncbi:MAG: polysaccharide deacetylase family protein [Candidatus Doudnabacteria bacterium]|nr:polysaccharide deacetylase family protein [Candidatus Doudnabacteria bacterium]